MRKSDRAEDTQSAGKVGRGHTAVARQPGGEIRRETYKAPEYAYLYTNDIRIETTPWDVRLILGELESGPTEERRVARVRETAELRMSPQQALALIAMLGGQLAKYESNFGEIPVPKEIRALFPTGS